MQAELNVKTRDIDLGFVWRGNGDRNRGETTKINAYLYLIAKKPTDVGISRV